MPGKTVAKTARKTVAKTAGKSSGMSTSRRAMYVVGLDARGRPCGVAEHPRRASLSFVKVWELATLAERLGAAALLCVVVAGGPPRDRPRPPSEHERACFEGLRERARRAGIVLVDCVVVRDGARVSLRRPDPRPPHHLSRLVDWGP